MFKFQRGGNLESFFTVYKPVLMPSSKQSSGRQSAAKEDKSDDITEKDIMTMLDKIDGLPNEMNRLTRNLTNMLQLSKLTGDTSSLSTSSLSTSYLNCLYELKNANFNKKQFDETKKIAETKGSLNDIAITQNGSILALDKQLKIVKLTPTEWAKVKNSGEYEPLTNSNLLWLRSHRPEYINDNSLFLIVENGIGLDYVNKIIKERFNKIGLSETSGEYFVSKEISKGAEVLNNMLLYGPEGFYKIKELDKKDLGLIDATLAYIYSTLPANAKTRLALETSDGKLSSVLNIIKAMLFGTIDTKKEVSAEYMGTDAKLYGKDKTSGSDDKIKDNAATKFLKGYGYIENYKINLGDSNSIIVRSNVMPLTGKDDKDLGIGKPISDVIEGSYGRIFDLKSASIGGAMISPHELSLVISEDGKIRSIDYPCIINRDGTIVPRLDAETRSRKDAADKELKDMGIDIYNPNDIKTKYLKINLVYSSHELTPPYKAGGVLNEDYWARFAVMNVATDENVLKGADITLIREVDDDFEALRIITSLQESDEDYSTRSGFLGLSSVDIYKGSLWIPITESYNAATGPEMRNMTETELLDVQDLMLRQNSKLTDYLPS